MATLQVVRDRGTGPKLIQIHVPDLSAEELVDVRVRAAAYRETRVPPIEGMNFLARLTDDEYAAILQAAQAGLAGGQPQLLRWIDMLRLQGSIHLASEEAQGAKAALIAGNLLSQARADAVFSASGEAGGA